MVRCQKEGEGRRKLGGAGRAAWGGGGLNSMEDGIKWRRHPQPSEGARLSFFGGTGGKKT